MDLWGTWVAQSVKSLTLDFSSGHDLTVHGIEPHMGPGNPAWDSLSPSLSLCNAPACTHAFSLKINKQINKLKKRM